MFIFDIEMLGHLQSRCFNSDPYQQADYFVCCSCPCLQLSVMLDSYRAAVVCAEVLPDAEMFASAD
jgi:hypothetical protein